MSEVLNLAGADMTAFEPPKNGTWDAAVTGITDVEITREDGKLPQGTPGLNVEFTIQGGTEDGKKVWNRYWMPGEDYDPDKRSKTIGMLARFFVAIGYSEKEVTAGKFKLDRDDAIGRECRITTRINDEGYANVRRVEPKGANLEESGGLL